VIPIAAGAVASSGGGLTFQRAWDSWQKTTLLNYLLAVTGPRVALNPTPLIGVGVASQNDADALVGRIIEGPIDCTVGGYNLSNFEIRATAHGQQLLTTTGSIALNANNITLKGNGFRADGMGGSNFAGPINLHRIRCEGLVDSLRTRDNSSTYTQVLVRNPYAWDEVAEGRPWDTGDNHSDALQSVRGTGFTLADSMLDMGVYSSYPNTPGIISAMLFKPDSAPISDVTISRVWCAGGGYTIRFLDNDAMDDWPTNVTVSDVRVERNSYNSQAWESTGVPNNVFAISNLRYTDDQSLIPTGFGEVIMVNAAGQILVSATDQINVRAA
jgi:hypothetical protein